MNKRAILTVVSIVITCAFSINVFAVQDAPLKDKYKGADVSEGEFDHTQTVNSKYYKEINASYELYGYGPADADMISLSVNDALVRRRDNKTAPMDADDLIEISEKQAFKWNSEISTIEWSFDISTEGLYCIDIDYLMPEEMDSASNRELRIDGEIPFFEAGNIRFDPLWVDSGPPIVNNLGDDVWPQQNIVERWITSRISDANALYEQPFEFLLKTGEHKITLKYINNEMMIGDCRILPLPEIMEYKDVYKSYLDHGYADSTSSPGIIQAEEKIIEKNSPTIRREYDADPLTFPQSLTNRKLNVIGGWRWRSGTQKITWSFRVPETGLYKLAFRAINVWNDGLPSYREIKIDGEVPFSEMLAYRFDYNTNWQSVILESDQKEPYLFYFDKDNEHTISMMVTLAPFRDVIYSLNEDTILLSKILREIGMIVGSDPDPNYDYELERAIPSLVTDLQTLMDSMQWKYDQINSMSRKTPAMANNFLTIKAQMESMKNNPFTIPRRINDLTNAMTSLSNWYREIQNQPLMLDTIMIVSPDEVITQKVSSVFQRMWSTVVNFLISFTKDYDNIGSVLEGDSSYDEIIKVWVAYGTEWAELIKQMADTGFTNKEKILVNMNVLPANQLNAGGVNTLMLAITSGKAPDVALGSSSTSPVEFAIRDATYELSAFPDFTEVKERFLDSLFVPYTYDNGSGPGIYALPETMNFNVMFYRKDIISELNIRIPQTRQELYKDVLPVLYQNNLQFFFPVDFSQFIFQHGADYYTEDGKYSALGTPEGFQAFKECTEVFMNYGVPVTADFFNRMRSGEMPMGISNFRLYMLFTAAAPELVGRWGIAPIPGTMKSDGTIDRSAGGLAGECAIIMNQTEKPDAAWKFLKWWTSDEVQAEFGKEIESLVGTDARWNTANLDAFNSLPWGEGDLEVIQQYWERAKEPPVVLGSYFTGRHLNNAWNRVIINGQPIRDALEEAVYDIDRELRMKREEYGVYD